jgi:hypothetical protein
MIGVLTRETMRGCDWGAQQTKVGYFEWDKFLSERDMVQTRGRVGRYEDSCLKIYRRSLDG